MICLQDVRVTGELLHMGKHTDTKDRSGIYIGKVAVTIGNETVMIDTYGATVVSTKRYVFPQ